MAFEVKYRENCEALVTYLVESDDSQSAELEAPEAGEVVSFEVVDIKREILSVFPANSADHPQHRMWAAYVYNPNAESGTTQRNHRLFLLPESVMPQSISIDDLVEQLGLEIGEDCDLDIIEVNEQPVSIQL